ncbi:MAG: putative membrane protein SpoIIM required for sporulation [Vicingaceae bacterium]|jgi:uncharacterized membrane protein SpoIIM required for sporulation
MREASYLAKNEEKWRKVEALLDKNQITSTEESSNLFIELTDDLSYAQTHYPGSPTTEYLNQLAIGIFKRINKNRKSRENSFLKFWRYEVPMAVLRNHKALLFSFLFFTFFVLLGAFSTHYDEEYPRYVLGDNYVETTLKNIKDGDPMGIYKSSGQENMFWGITLNNLRVSAMTFVAGIFVCFGTCYFLFKNAIMLGCFQYFFVTKGLFIDSFLAIWIHGTVEISCIIIAGAAGISLGRSFMFPGTLSRKDSFIRGARDSVLIFLSIVPLIILAGFLESFVTRLTEAPTLFRMFIILGSLTLILFYYVYYPRQLKKQLPLA